MLRLTLLIYLICSTCILLAQSSKVDILLKDVSSRINQKEWKESIIVLNLIIEIDPNNFVAYSLRGLCNRKLEYYKESLSDYNKSIKLKPAPMNYEGRGITKSALKDYRGAISDYTIAIEGASPSVQYIIYHNRGDAKRLLNDYKGAIADYSKSIELNKDYSYPYYERGLLKIFFGDKDSGCLDLSKAGELGYMDAYFDIGVLCK